MITPIVKRAVKEREDFYTNLAAVNALYRCRWEKLPRVSFPLLDGRDQCSSTFAKIGLLFTKNLDRIRDERYKPLEPKGERWPWLGGDHGGGWRAGGVPTQGGGPPRPLRALPTTLPSVHRVRFGP
jgi:hypothetical protein